MARKVPGEKIHAVIDTNVFTSAHLSNKGASYEIIKKWKEEKCFIIVSSNSILEEITRVLLEKGISNEVIEDFVTALDTIGIVVEGIFVVYKIEKDVSDNIFLAAALEGKADFIVTLDKELLNLKNYLGVQIVTSKAFLEILRKEQHARK